MQVSNVVILSRVFHGASGHSGERPSTGTNRKDSLPSTEAQPSNGTKYTVRDQCPGVNPSSCGLACALGAAMAGRAEGEGEAGRLCLHHAGTTAYVAARAGKEE